ncbi:MAG TPA: hypothetical protein VGN64_17810 [Dyadobacter sp.]|jgi:hypothetical protein|nr:hypothetical protein [Dyadobacter sp.]
MKWIVIFGIVVLFASSAQSQPCTLLTQTFAVADTIKKDSKELYVFRFSDQQLNEISVVPGLEKAVAGIKKLQKTLDEDNVSLKQGNLWQLDVKLAERQLKELRSECSETRFLVFEREMNYYREKFKPKAIPK